MSRRECVGDDPGPGRAEEFLGRVRGRLVLSGLLAAALFAAALNEAARWSAAAAVVYLGWKVPVFGWLGLLVLAALVPPTLRRWTPAAAAARADVRLGLRDRLASLVDFRARAGIPADVRRAQAAETALALAGATPAAAVPIAAWRKAGPALLALCLVYQFFLPARWSRQSPLVRVATPVSRLGDPRATAEAPSPPPGDAPPGAERGPEPERADARAPGEAGNPHGPNPAAGDPARRRAAGRESEVKLADGDPGKGGRRAGPDRGSGGEDPRRPGRIESERVGAQLARVVDPLYRTGPGQAAAAVPGGVATFHLLPQAGGGGGGAPFDELRANGLVPEPVRVDLDAVLAPYRPIVKAYFDQLARAAAPRGGVPQP